MGGERQVTFFVAGAPIPQGSVTAHAAKRKDGSHYGVVHYAVGTKLHRWRNKISKAARAEWGDDMTYHPVTLALVFYRARPLSHYQGLAFDVRPRYVTDVPDTSPDLDKLVRAVMDALTDVVYVDDSQVVEIGATKRYVPNREHPPGVEVSIIALP